MLRLSRLAAVFVLWVLCLPVLAQSEIFAAASDTPITSDNGADVVPLARYGRGTAGSLAWSPDGTRLAVGGSAGVWLYRVTDFDAELSPLVAHTAPVMSLAFNRDGSRLVSGGADSSLRVWDTDSDELLQTLEVPYSAAFVAVAYSPDDSLIVTADLNTLLIWDAESGELDNQITADANATIAQLAFAPNSTRLAVRLVDGTLKWFEITTGDLLVTLPVDGTYVSEFAWLPDATGIIRATGGQGWQRYDATENSLMAFVSQGAENARLTSVTVAPDGSTLATGEANSIRFWNPATGEETGLIDAGEPVNKLAYSPDGSALAALTETGSLILWDTESQEISVSLNGVYHNSAAQLALFSPDAAQIAVAYLDSTGTLLSTATGEFTTPVLAVDALFKQPSMAYNTAGTLLAVSDGFGISLKNPETGEEAAYLRTIFTPVFAWSPDGTVIAAGDSTGTLYLWDTAGTLLLSRTDHTQAIASIVFSTEGNLILTASGDGTVRLYGLAE